MLLLLLSIGTSSEKNKNIYALCEVFDIKSFRKGRHKPFDLTHCIFDRLNGKDQLMNFV